MTGSEQLWFDVPEHFEPWIDASGDPWLICMLPLAVTKVWDISLDLPIDGRLQANVGELMLVWHDWYPDLEPVRIEARVARAGLGPAPTKTGLFFSGGVDSFYSLLHAQETGEEAIDDLVLIHGFDIPIDNSLAFDRLAGQAARVADAYGESLVPIATNFRHSRFQEASWMDLAFACLLGGAGLTLGNRYRRLIISSGQPRGDPQPHTSHPNTDPLMSTSRTTFVHYAGGISRARKTERISADPTALENLRVCWMSQTGLNCGRCTKCLRTMATLEILGKLDTTATFPPMPNLTRALQRQYLLHELPFILDVRSLAAEHGRADIVQAIDGAVKRTAWLDRLMLFGLVRRARLRLQRSAAARQWLRPVFLRLQQLGTRLNTRLP